MSHNLNEKVEIKIYNSSFVNWTDKNNVEECWTVIVVGNVNTRREPILSFLYRRISKRYLPPDQTQPNLNLNVILPAAKLVRDQRPFVLSFL